MGNSHLLLKGAVDEDTSNCTPQQLEAMELARQVRKPSYAKAEAQQHRKVSMSYIQVQDVEVEAYNGGHHPTAKQELIPIDDEEHRARKRADRARCTKVNEANLLNSMR